MNVFISHATGDEIFAELTRMKLQEAGIDVWYDKDSLHVGEEWRQAIDEGITSCDVCLAILTPASCSSPYVTYEWAFALGRGIRVIPLLRERAEIHPRLKVLQYLDFLDGKKAPWADLIKEIQKSACRRSEGKPRSGYVRDMTVQQLEGLISGAVALAQASSKAPGEDSPPVDIARAAKSVIDMYTWRKDAKSERTRGRDGIRDALERHRILWVDDRPENNIHERKAFEQLGFDFTLALSTKEALEILSQDQFSAVISDMGRREGPREGYVLLDTLRKRGDQTPYFFYAGSGSRSPEHRREAAEHGAQGSTNLPQELFEMITQSLK
ncbi:MAG: TIR domain-containing protein [Candidatus Eisenbacteria bacterium]|nr:TIR domain-containing protein [Candidatus Eisenbacteria bacterium]